jgi:hypothetical protein
VVQAGGKSIKLPVTGNGTGGSTAPPPKLETRTATRADAPPASLRAGGGYLSYWNISNGNVKIPIDMGQVKAIRFTAEHVIIIEYRNGQTIEISDYQGGSFDIEPAPTLANGWDMERTLAIGGASYGYDCNLNPPMTDKVEYISAVSKTDIVIFDVRAGKETKYPRSGISGDLLNKDGAVISFATISDISGLKSLPAISLFEITQYGIERINFYDFSGRWFYGAGIQYYDFNNGTNRISSTFVTNADGSLTVNYTNADGVSREHTFKK